MAGARHGAGLRRLIACVIFAVDMVVVLLA